MKTKTDKTFKTTLLLNFILTTIEYFTLILKDVFRSFILKKGMALPLFLLISIFSYGQDAYYPHGIDVSKANNRNANHIDGTELQDLKRSVGFFVKYLDGHSSLCSCNLLNNTMQDRTPYISTAGHCVSDYNVGEFHDAYFSFDFEMSDALNRGNPEDDIYISGVYKAQYEVVFKDINSDLALLKLVKNTYNPQLLSNAYAVGWDNTVTNTLYSNISHPEGDHKKVFIKPDISKFDWFAAQDTNNNSRHGFFYSTNNRWNGINVSTESGSSGSGYFSEINLLKAIDSHESDYIFAKISRSSTISNKWYGLPNETQHFAKYLDANTTWINAIPGGYINDLITLNDEDFTLEVKSGIPLLTPSVNLQNPTILDNNVLWMTPAILFDILDYNNALIQIFNRPLWTEISGIKTVNDTDSDLFLLVYYLDKDAASGLYTKRLLYGTHSAGNVAIKHPVEFGFKGDSWNCENPPPNYPPCNRIRTGFFNPVMGDSHDIKRSYINAAKKINHGGFIGLSETEIPIVVELQNIGTSTASVQAVSYPGDVPKNALQLFKPEEVWSKFKSKKYHPSRGLLSENLFINSVTVTQDETDKTISTGNNGGYLNLVNPNFLIGPIKTSYIDTESENKQTNKLELTLDVANRTGESYYAKVWIDFFPFADSKHFYNFVDDTPVQHNIELVHQTDSPSWTTEYKFTIDMPTNIQLDMKPGDSKLCRTRIAISDQDNIAQYETYSYGEVEDYLIKIQVPTAAEAIASAAKIHIPVRAGVQPGIDNNSCGVPEQEPETSAVVAPVNVGDATLPYSCNNFVCAGTDCATQAANGSTPFDGNYSLCVSGTSDYVALDDGNSLLNDAFSNRTVSFWLNNNNDTGIETVYDEGGSTDGGLGIRINNTTQKLEVAVRSGAVLKTISATPATSSSGSVLKTISATPATSSSGSVLKTISATPATSSWVHVVAVFDNGTLSLYQNGTLSAQDTSIGFTSVPAHLDEAGFGGTNGTNVFNEMAKSYNGCADEILIFSKVLTPADITVLYQEGISSPSSKINQTKPLDPKQKTQIEKLIIYPNPAKGDSFNLITEVKEVGTVKIQIFDLLGKIVYEKNYNGVSVGFQNITLKNLTLQAATYVVKVANGGHEQSGKLVVE